MIYFDLETIPWQADHVAETIRADIEAEIEAIKPPGNYKKAEAIEAYKVAEAAKLRESFDAKYRKCSLDGTRGEIVSIAFCVDDGEIYSATESSESELIKWFWTSLVTIVGPYGDLEWCGHNIRSFDLPFLYKRCVINNIRPPFSVPWSSGPSDKRVFDTMTAWAGWNKFISQANLCKALGIEAQDGISGSEVYDYWQEDKLREIREHNAADVAQVRKIHKRMIFAF